jgi:hypothetical protein
MNIQQDVFCNFSHDQMLFSAKKFKNETYRIGGKKDMFKKI